MKQEADNPALNAGPTVGAQMVGEANERLGHHNGDGDRTSAGVPTAAVMQRGSYRVAGADGR
jgi:hypothetical protein